MCTKHDAHRDDVGSTRIWMTHHKLEPTVTSPAVCSHGCTKNKKINNTEKPDCENSKWIPMVLEWLIVQLPLMVVDCCSKKVLLDGNGPLPMEIPLMWFNQTQMHLLDYVFFVINNKRVQIQIYTYIFKRCVVSNDLRKKHWCVVFLFDFFEYQSLYWRRDCVIVIWKQKEEKHI